MIKNIFWIVSSLTFFVFSIVRGQETPPAYNPAQIFQCIHGDIDEAKCRDESVTFSLKIYSGRGDDKKLIGHAGYRLYSDGRLAFKLNGQTVWRQVELGFDEDNYYLAHPEETRKDMPWSNLIMYAKDEVINEIVESAIEQGGWERTGLLGLGGHKRKKYPKESQQARDLFQFCQTSEQYNACDNTNGNYELGNVSVRNYERRLSLLLSSVRLDFRINSEYDHLDMRGERTEHRYMSIFQSDYLFSYGNLPNSARRPNISMEFESDEWYANSFAQEVWERLSRETLISATQSKEVSDGPRNEEDTDEVQTNQPPSASGTPL